jgi:hypothetical protein
MKIISITLLLINIFSIEVARAEEKVFCKESVISMSGSACWALNIYSTPRIEKKGIDNTVFIDMKIPYLLFEESKHREFGPQSLIALSLSIKKNENKKSTHYDSRFVISGSNRVGDTGIKSFIESFSNRSSYSLAGESDSFYIYKRIAPISSFEYLVPKQNLEAVVYLRCVKNCSMCGVYRNVLYEFHFPISWKKNYLDLKNLAESFLDSIIVNVEIKGVR